MRDERSHGDTVFGGSVFAIWAICCAFGVSVCAALHLPRWSRSPGAAAVRVSGYALLPSALAIAEYMLRRLKHVASAEHVVRWVFLPASIAAATLIVGSFLELSAGTAKWHWKLLRALNVACWAYGTLLAVAVLLDAY